MIDDPELLFAEIPFKLPISERLAINAVADLNPQRVLCTTSGRGQCAIHLARQNPESAVYCHFIESFAASETAELATTLEAGVNVLCSADLPEEPFDMCVLPMARSGESELSRDLLQQAYHRLEIHGTLIVTIDHPQDTWFHHEIEKLGKNLSRMQKRKGMVYKLRKINPLKKLRDFSCDFAFRDGETLVKAMSLPGVFSHRHLDLGARALIESMQVNQGDHVLDIGCGSGAVGLAAGLRAKDVTVHFLDSNARALECALAGSELNGLKLVEATHAHDGSIGSEDNELQGTFDLALGNPPYYSHFQIAEIFLQSARRALKPGGRVLIVAKQTDWLKARMEQLFDDTSIQEKRGYFVVTGRQRS